MNDAAALFRELDAQREYSDLLIDIGEVCRDQGDYRAALGYLADALTLKSRIGGNDDIARVELVTASVLRLSGDLPAAWTRARRAADLVRRSDDRLLRRDILEELAITAEFRRDMAEALRYRKEFQALQAALFSEESRRKMNELQARYETEVKDQEIALLKRQADVQRREIRRETVLRSLILALLGMTAAIAVLLYTRVRFRARAHRNLERAHEEARRAQEALEDAVNNLERTVRLDKLTGIPNRIDMIERMEAEVQRFERYGKPFVILIADIDDFKSVNDKNGHEGGDFILQSVSATIRDALRKLDSVARWGGDEFLILLPETDLEGGRTVAEKIRWSVAESLYTYKGRTIPVTLTLGVSVYDRPGDSNDVLRKADEALYEGKTAGRDRVVASSASAV
jgi:diguanylate cyclase (GGDEF)-like protein